MSSWAKPGAKCVCICDDWNTEQMDAFGVKRVPMINEVLTIRAVVVDGAKVGLQFHEVPTLSTEAWTIRYFRPLVTKTQQEDVELFRHLLTSTDMPERV